ncbi:MAG: Squamous cell carcinoma antigen recognized by T-cells 3 [Paramarteilia canceri]
MLLIENTDDSLYLLEHINFIEKYGTEGELQEVYTQAIEHCANNSEFFEIQLKMKFGVQEFLKLNILKNKSNFNAKKESSTKILNHECSKKTKISLIQDDLANEPNTVFISNLDYFETEENLSKILLENMISCTKILLCNVKKSSGRHSGYGYVTLSSCEDYLNLLNLDRKLLLKDSRPLYITKAGDKFTKPEYSTNEEKNKIFVKGFAKFTSESELNNYFEPYGPVISCRLVKKKNGESKGIAYIDLENEGKAQRAVEDLNGKLFGQNKLFVAISNPQKAESQSKPTSSISSMKNEEFRKLFSLK